MNRPVRVAVVVSHPIQHFCPQYTSWAALPGVGLKVFFASNHGLVPYQDKGFGRTVKWDKIKLEFSHEFLKGAEGRAVGPNIDSPDIAERLSAFSPNVVLVEGYIQPLQRRALRWAQSTGIPVLMNADSELRTPRSWIKRVAKAVVLPQVLRRVALFLTVGDANEQYFRNYGIGDNRFVRCFFPIDVQHYDSVVARRDEAKTRIRTELGIPGHHKVLLMVGKLVPWKRQVDLVRFSNSIQDNRDDVTVVLAGTGQDELSLRKLTRRNGAGGVLFAGFVPPDVLAEYYCAADVYVHCSASEPHSLAISEAIYCGLPVVLSDRCGSYGPTDDVQPGVNGYVYRCGDVADMSRRLLRLLAESDMYLKMRSASERLGKEHQQLAHGVALTRALAIINSNQTK
jgi:glycosyltransferase involved in cell wall biosynthesis